MPTIQVNSDIKGLREVLCAAQSLASLLPTNISMVEYLAFIEELINECDKHRPLGPDGKHGMLHTPTCGCEDEDKGHGPWCVHTGCEGCGVSSSALIDGTCTVCGHQYPGYGSDKPILNDHHAVTCDHRACPTCWRSYLRERKCLLCGHDWSDPTLRGAQK